MYQTNQARGRPKLKRFSHGGAGATTREVNLRSIDSNSLENHLSIDAVSDSVQINMKPHFHVSQKASLCENRIKL